MLTSAQNENRKYYYYYEAVFTLKLRFRRTLKCADFPVRTQPLISALSSSPPDYQWGLTENCTTHSGWDSDELIPRI